MAETTDKTGQEDFAAAEESRKALDSLRRAVSETRMRDYGLVQADVEILLSTVDVANPWDEICEQLADAHVARATQHAAAADEALAAQEYEWAAAALNIGQIAFNQDNERKVALYGRAVTLLKKAASYKNADFQPLEKLGDPEPIAGWQFGHERAHGCALVVGGLSGWSISYFSLARALVRQGIAVLLIDGPGQGETRMRYGAHLSHAALARFAPAIERAQSFGGGVAVIGNSFGGLIAAHLAARWDAVRACCINGAVPNSTVPAFRAAREQMTAAFGADGADLIGKVAEFSFDAAITPIRAPVLILEGGADPLVPTGAQAGFLPAGPAPSGSLTRHWPNGEHTIYNHASERNGFVAAWIADRLAAARK